jgi:hypothetical protein
LGENLGLEPAANRQISQQNSIAATNRGLNEELMARTDENGSSARSKSLATKKLSAQEQIAVRAYEIYLERDGAPGDPLEDWVRAEREVLEKSGKTSKKVTTSVA